MLLVLLLLMLVLVLHCTAVDRVFDRNPNGRPPLVEPPPVRTVSPQAKPYNGYVVAPSPQRGTLPVRFPVAHRRWSGQFAVAPTPQTRL